MKKAIVFILVALLAVSMAFAASGTKGATKRDTWGLGLNLGTNTGIDVKYGLGDFDVFANVGFDIISAISDGSLGATVEVGASYMVYDIKIDRDNHLPITVGAMVPLSFLITDNSLAFNLGILAQAGIEYQIPDVPVSFYLRLGIGLGLDIVPDFSLGLAYSGAIGVLYVF